MSDADAIGGRRFVGIVGELGSDLVDLAPVKRVAHAFEVDAAVEDEQGAEDPCAAALDGGESRSPAAARRGARELDREGGGDSVDTALDELVQLRAEPREQGTVGEYAAAVGAPVVDG